MNVVPKLTLWLAVSFLLAFGARAQEAQHEVKTATTLICGSASDAKHFLTENQNLQQALAEIHEKSNAGKSCLLAPIAFIAGKGIDRVERSDGTFIVTEIMIVGVGTPVGVLAIKPAVVYTVVQVDEEAA